MSFFISYDLSNLGSGLNGLLHLTDQTNYAFCTLIEEFSIRRQRGQLLGITKYKKIEKIDNAINVQKNSHVQIVLKVPFLTEISKILSKINIIPIGRNILLILASFK
jgi:hypothetical protein